MEIYVVTDTEMGWDNIMGVYTNEPAAKKHKEYRGQTCVVHTVTLKDEFISDDEE